MYQREICIAILTIILAPWIVTAIRCAVENLLDKRNRAERIAKEKSYQDYISLISNDPDWYGEGRREHI